HLALSSSGDHRHLRSFPTRRSSDLGFEPRHECACQPLIARVAYDVVNAVSDGDLRRAVPAPVIDDQPFHLVEARYRSRRSPRRTDRKSTRLNSSHVKISYAVFCLKK